MIRITYISVCQYNILLITVTEKVFAYSLFAHVCIFRWDRTLFWWDQSSSRRD